MELLICRISETEKYPLITSVFNGGTEKENPGETRLLVSSPKKASKTAVAKASLEVTDQLLKGLETGKHDVFIANIAAADIAAHTGDLEKTIAAVEKVDECLGRIVRKIMAVDGVALITSDHGNCEDIVFKFFPHLKSGSVSCCRKPHQGC